MTGAASSSVKRYRELARHHSRNGRERELLLDGPHLLLEARSSGIHIESAAFEHSTLDDPSTRQLAERLTADGADVLIVSRKTLDSMSPVTTPSGVVGIARRRIQSVAEVFAQPQAFIVVAQMIQDPGNVGAIVRSAEAAGATALVACSGTADPFGWKALRGSMGSALRMPLAFGEIDEIFAATVRAGIRTAALVPRGGRSLFGANLARPLAVLLGGEGGGLPDAIASRVDQRISIPMQAPVESLNVGVAAALVLYEAYKQR